MQILVVNGDASFVEVLREGLEKKHTVIEAQGGEEWLEKINEEPDIILLDIAMPGGLDICKKIKDSQKAKDIPVILLNGGGGEQDILEGLELGAADYLPKTYSRNILLAKIDFLLKTKRTEDELRRKAYEMERFTRLAVDRELKMIELKRMIKKLESELKMLKGD